MKILLIRHGEPDYSIDSLTEKGWREADILAKRLIKLPIDDFYVSPLGRAKDTARATLKLFGKEAETLDWLQEFRGYVINPKTGQRSHAWDFMPQYWTRCPEFYDMQAWRENGVIATGNSGVIYDETVTGLDGLLARYGYKREGCIYKTERNDDRTIALFCHFGITTIMLSHLLRIPPHLLLHGFICAPSSVTTLQTEERLPGEVWFRCIQMGDTSHLYEAGEPVSHYGRFEEVYGKGPAE
ncbi:MAG: histidine phosphatase family protein [Clostridia bacterium]|nr:histidine phosphatase family protein [Clostridia bacterium]